jgi:hypothetical protein
MLELTKGNIQTITKTIDQADITVSHLRDDLIDHVCCEVEQMMQQGLDFNIAFAQLKNNIGIKDLQKVQEQTLLFIDKIYCVMKTTLKVSGVVSTVLLTFGSLFKTMHWPGASVLLLLGFFALCFFFLPSANYVMHREKKDRGMAFLFISAFLGSFGFLLGLLFKIMHWPGANILLLAGLATLILLFFPTLWVKVGKKAPTNKLKAVYTIGIASGMIYLFGLLSKLMHWPGASIALISGSVMLVFVFVPALTFQKYKTEQRIKISYIYLIAAISWFTLFSMLLSLSMNRNMALSLVDEGIILQRAVDQIENQNKKMDGSTLGAIQSSKIAEIHQLADDLCAFIESAKTDMVGLLDNQNPNAIQNGKVNLIAVSNWTNMSSPNLVMMGLNGNGKAFQIKNMLDITRNSFVEILGSDNQAALMIGALLDTSVPKQVKDKNISWEGFYFEKTHLIVCLNELTILQRNVRLAEMETISSLIEQKTELSNL